MADIATLVTSPEVEAKNELSVSILEAMTAESLFGPWFEPWASWERWYVFLAALFGLPMNGAQLAVYREHTNRATPPIAAAREAWVIVGRRGGKSRIAALIALYLAVFRDYRELLAPGETGTIPIIAADRKEARTVMGYINGFLDHVPLLRERVIEQTKEAITFRGHIRIELHTASFRSVRGYSLIAAICDEIAFWRTDEQSANPDSETIAALRPGMATIPGSMLIAISSPYARRGTLWEAYDRHFGRDGDRVLVWNGPTRAMNPSIDPSVIQDAYAEDEAKASAEYGAEFRTDIEGFVSREAIDAVTVPGRIELKPSDNAYYEAFVDPSGGAHDSMTLAIGHLEGRQVILDCLRERRAPLNPLEVVAEFAAVLRDYGIGTVHGDRYGGEWPSQYFREHDIHYVSVDKTRSQLYVELLPILNAGAIQLLDNKRLRAQLLSLERTTGSSGRDIIDHPPGGHDDLANAVAGLAARCVRDTSWYMVDDAFCRKHAPLAPKQGAESENTKSRLPTSAAMEDLCGNCAHFVPGRAGSQLRFGLGSCNERQFIMAAKSAGCRLHERSGETPK